MPISTDKPVQWTTLPRPLPSSILPHGRKEANWSSEEIGKIDELKVYFSQDDYTLPAGGGTAEGASGTRHLNDVERMTLSEEGLVRYLIAVRWISADAIKRIEETLAWRRSTGMDDVAARSEECIRTINPGKSCLMGYSRQANPVFYDFSAKVTMPCVDQDTMNIVFFVERAIDLLPRGVEQMVFFSDLSGKLQTDSSAMAQGRLCLSILQAHYPERLASIGALDAPWIVRMFLYILMNFVDEKTKKKVLINPYWREVDIIPPDQLLSFYGGEVNWEWTPDYIPQLSQLCIERRESHLRRWKEAGGRVGLSEWDFLGEA